VLELRERERSRVTAVQPSSRIFTSAAGIHHRLDREEHARPQRRALSGRRSADVRRFVELAPDAVAAEVRGTTEKRWPLHVGLDGVADVAERRTRADRADAAHHRLVGHVHQQPCLGGGLARHVHAARVAVPAIEDDGDVDVDDVALGQQAVAGDAVADHVVDRGAGRLGVAAVAERRGHGAAGQHEVVNELVDLLGGHARLNMRGDHIERLGSQPSGAAHPLEIEGSWMVMRRDSPPCCSMMSSGRPDAALDQWPKMRAGRPGCKAGLNRNASRPAARIAG
jgi:hypothetical protein